MIPESDEHLMRRAILGLAPKVGQTYTEGGHVRTYWTVFTVNSRDVVLMHGDSGKIISRDQWLVWLRGKKRIT